MTNKKILNFIPNFSFGGVETTNINFSETLIKFGYEVDLLTNDYKRVNKPEYFNNVKSLRKSKMLFCLLPLIKYINNTKPDLIICSQFYANIIVLLACFISGYKNKIILCERVPVFENLKKLPVIKKNVIKFLIKRLYKKADKIVCNSYGTKNDLNKIKYPAGLNIGATTPQEISTAILAEIVKKSRPKIKEELVMDFMQIKEGQEKDPICGMGVDPKKTEYQLEYKEKIYYFCCGGCLDKFESKPAVYI